LAAEVLSPNDRASQVLAKVDDYLRNGVRVVWLVDPESRTVRVYRPNQPTINLAADDEINGGDELPGFRCSLREFFLLSQDPAAANAPPAS
jgi:Uma2 family endonuclease